MNERFQNCTWYVKLWRLRHYVYIPFRFIRWKLRRSPEFNDKIMWRILVGSAQCDMNWTYTQEEVMERLKQNKDE